jgi:hypothetical protein
MKLLGRPPKVKVKGWVRAEVWQDGMMVACVEGVSRKAIEKDICHYASLYAMDGPVTVRYPQVDDR